jgi:hypothetical protein
MRERDLLVHAMENPLNTSLYRLLQQNDATSAMALNGSFGWVPGTDKETK